MRYRLVSFVAALAIAAASCTGETSVFDLEVGDCFNDQDLTQTEVASVPVVDCAEPHDNEIYSQYSMIEASFPGIDATYESAMRRCLEGFSAFVGIEYRDSILDIFPITPTAASWESGDRVVQCALYAGDLSKLAGSMRGSGR